MSQLRMAVIGVGHLGKEHARILTGLPGVELVGVADVSADQAETVARRHNTQAFTDYWPLLNLVDAACIVVPTAEHFSVAKEFLRRGIPLLVEKPLASTLPEAEALVNLARANDAILQVGHIERFNPAFVELQKRPLQPKFIRSERLSSFSGRSADIGVVLDLMIHDLDILLVLVKSPVVSVEALGVCLFGGHEDVANARLRFANGCVAELTASRASPAQHRCMHIWGPEGYAKVDFSSRRLHLVQPSAQLRREGLDPRRLDPAARARIKEELFTRYLETATFESQGTDQLTSELQDFVDCVRSGQTPRVSGVAGRDTMALAQQILSSIRTHAWHGVAEGPTGAAEAAGTAGTVVPAAEG